VHQYTCPERSRNPEVFHAMMGSGSHILYSVHQLRETTIWVKLPSKPNRGIQNLTDAEAGDNHSRGIVRASCGSLTNHSSRGGDSPDGSSTVPVHERRGWNTITCCPYRLAQVCAHAGHPLIEVGEMELNRNARKLLRGRRAGCVPQRQSSRYQLLADTRRRVVFLLWRHAALIGSGVNCIL